MFIRGGLYLVSNAVIAISTSSVVVAESIDEARNTLIQVYWRIQANNIIEDTKFSVKKDLIEYKPWFINPNLDESIKKVVGKAIADCVTNMHQFKNKNAGEIITFEGTTPATYEQKHWNAVMLYNYVNDAIKGSESNSQVILDDCYDRILQHYKLCDSKAQDRISTAQKVIGKYVKDLELGANLVACKPYYNKNDKNDLLYSVPKCNEIVSYRSIVDIFPWRVKHASTIKTWNTIKFEYKSNFGLGITSITERCATLRKSGFLTDYYYNYVWYESDNVTKQLKSINFADLLSDLPLKIYRAEELGEDLVKRYQEINAKTRESMSFEEEQYNCIPWNDWQAEYNGRVIQDRMKMWGVKHK